MASDAHANGKDSVRSFDSGRGSDVGNDATVVDDMSNGTCKLWTTHL